MEVLVVMSSLFTLLIILIAILAPMPGRIAKKRNHPHAKAIRLSGWTSILTGTITGWVLALKWAHDDSPNVSAEYKQQIESKNRKHKLF